MRAYPCGSWTESEPGDLRCATCGHHIGFHQSGDIPTPIPAPPTETDRIAALESEMKTLKRLLSEYIPHNCHLNWGNVTCLEHGRDDCLYIWAEEVNQ